MNLQTAMERRTEMQLRMLQQKEEDEGSRSGSDNSNVSSYDRKKALKLRIVGQFINQDRKGNSPKSVFQSFGEPSKSGDVY